MLAPTRFFRPTSAGRCTPPMEPLAIGALLLAVPFVLAPLSSRWAVADPSITATSEAPAIQDPPASTAGGDAASDASDGTSNAFERAGRPQPPAVEISMGETQEKPRQALVPSRRSSRRQAAWQTRGQAATSPQLASTGEEDRPHQGWTAVARPPVIASQDAQCRCPRCGHAASHPVAEAAGEAPVVAHLGAFLRGLLGLDPQARPITETLPPDEPTAVLWDVKQRLGDDPLQGTIFSEPEYCAAGGGTWGGAADDAGATFVQWIRSRYSAGEGASTATTVAPRAAAEQEVLNAQTGDESEPDAVVHAPLAEDPADHAGGPSEFDALSAGVRAGEEPEEVRGIESLPAPHSEADLTECLRESSRQLEIVAHDLERHRFYDLADEVRYMAAQLRREARRREQTEQFDPDGAPAQPADPEATTTAQARLRTELWELRQEVARLRDLLLRSVDERAGKRR